MIRDDQATSPSLSACDEDVGSDGHQLSALAWRSLPVDTSATHHDPPPVVDSVLWRQVQTLISRNLTARQQQVLELYYLRGCDQATVAHLLGISQQSVSEHLFGKQRNRRQVGGVIPKLRKLCRREGIAPARRPCAMDEDG
jgi:hypothetical protein